MSEFVASLLRIRGLVQHPLAQSSIFNIEKYSFELNIRIGVNSALVGLSYLLNSLNPLVGLTLPLLIPIFIHQFISSHNFIFNLVIIP